ncbi:glycan-binding surface protein [uncultured Bacteroides sp.]|uniref:glycan-binding surface protein n=1 Tax=uncultured Bacteroides sp. TaxID=162156 RepID=UPI002AAB8140|nr:glycan-binding surface protein [uncultured Bacteroides sp.]
MKALIKNILFVAVAVASCFLTACKDEDNGSANTPVVRYVRSCDSARSDSLITKASLGSTIAIIGENLGDVKEVWFNDQQAKVNPVYVTDKSILISIPSGIPTDVTGKIRFVTQSGLESTYDFGVVVPSPVLNSMKCEYVADGDTAVIEGDFFLNPKVYFKGNMEAQIVNFTKTELKVIVPSGAEAGPVTVESMYGSTRSIFNFRDNSVVSPSTKLFNDFEETSSWNPWGLSAFASEDGLSGQYLKFEGTTGSWAWPANSLQFYYASSTRTPLVSSGDISTLALRFEANCKEWHDTPLLFWFTNNAGTHNVDGDDPQAHWKPYLKSGVKSNYVTDGWETITIPLSDFKYDKAETGGVTRSITSLSQLVDLHAMFFGAADGTYNLKLWIDNMRIVKYK